MKRRDAFEAAAAQRSAVPTPLDREARFCQGPFGSCGLPAVVVCSARETPDAPEDPIIRELIRESARVRGEHRIWPRDQNDPMDEFGPLQWYACSNPEHQGKPYGAYTMLLVDWFDLVRQWKERRELEDRQLAAAEVLDVDAKPRRPTGTR